MKLGFVSAILDGWSFEEMIDTASEIGFRCVEVACWPKGEADRRYAGVRHIDVDKVLCDDAYAEYVISYAKKKNVEFSSLAYYSNPLDPNVEKSKATIEHLEKVIKASAKLNVNMVTTFIGRDQTKTVDDNLKLVPQVWKPILALAEEKQVRIAIENCPMIFGKDQWPGGLNIFSSPSNWDKVFAVLDSKYLGINFDPSHCIWQFMDYVKPVKDYKDKIFHIHFKDIKLYRDKLNRVGCMAYPLDFMSPKLPSYGDVKWDEFVGALTDIGFDGCACIEIEDRAFEGSKEKILDSLKISKKYMENFVI